VTVSLIGGVLTAQCDNGFNTVTVDHSGSFAVINGTSWFDGTYNSIRINGGLGGTTSNIHANVRPLTVNGGGPDTANVGNGGRLTDILAAVTITDPPAGAFTAVNVDDSADPTFRTPTLDTVPIGGFDYGRISFGGVPVQYRYVDTSSVTFQTGAGGATVNVRATGAPTAVVGHGTNTVNVGDAGNTLASIHGSVSVLGGPSDTLTINDQGTAGARTYTVTPTTVAWGGPTVSYTGLGSLTVNGSAGGDTFDLAAGTSATAAVSLHGGGGNNTLVGPNAPTGFHISGSNAGNLSGGASASFSDIQNLTGGSGNDAFLFADGAGVGGNISDNNGAANSLDYSAYRTPVTVNLAASTATGVGGTVRNILTLVGGSSDDSLTGNAASRTFFFASPGNDSVTGLGTDNFLFSADANGTADSTWGVTAQNSGTLTLGASTTTFSGVQNLYGGGSGAATFVFADGAGVDGNISGSSLGGGGTNTLDYRAYSTSVIVDLQTGFATGVGGSVSAITVVFGGAGNGALGAYNLLIGGAGGGDTLTGGLGRRNLLVAGGGASTLHAGDQEDLLIGGFTNTYDTEAGLVSWLQIASYWAGTDLYATRVSNLTTPGSGVPLLDATTVTGNGGGNVMNGTGALALLYTDGLDNISGFDPASQQVLIAP
jgi:hypothetical protein